MCLICDGRVSAAQARNLDERAKNDIPAFKEEVAMWYLRVIVYNQPRKPMSMVLQMSMQLRQFFRF